MNILAGKAQYDASYFINSYIDYLKEIISKKEQIINNQDDVIAMLRCDVEDLKNENSDESKAAGIYNLNQEETQKYYAEKKELKDRIEQLENILDVSNKEYNEVNIRLNRVEEENKKLLHALGGVFHNGLEVDASMSSRYNEGMERLKTIGLSITDLKF